MLAARYTNPLTMLPGQVPINEHLERLLAGRVPFAAWFVEVDQMRGLNDSVGFEAGDALIHATAELAFEPFLSDPAAWLGPRELLAAAASA